MTDQAVSPLRRRNRRHDDPQVRGSENAYWLVGVQLLDGFGAGIFGALFPVIVRDIVGGSGRFNVSTGAIATAQGIGASLSAVVAGYIVVSLGYGTWRQARDEVPRVHPACVDTPIAAPGDH